MWRGGVLDDLEQGSPPMFLFDFAHRLLKFNLRFHCLSAFEWSHRDANWFALYCPSHERHIFEHRGEGHAPKEYKDRPSGGSGLETLEVCGAVEVECLKLPGYSRQVIHMFTKHPARANPGVFGHMEIQKPQEHMDSFEHFCLCSFGGASQLCEGSWEGRSGMFWVLKCWNKHMLILQGHGSGSKPG